jgi:hypothetical protein
MTEIELLRSLIGDLTAERVMARAEVERLRAELEQSARWRRQSEAELRAEIERLTWILNRIDRIEPETRAWAEAEWLRAEAKLLRK